MNKKIAITLAALLVVATMAGCGNSNSSSSSTSSSSASTSSSSASLPDSAPTPEPDEDNTPSGDDGSDVVDGTEGETDETLQAAYDSVKGAYGDNYIPSMAIEPQQLSEVYGVNMDNVESIVAEGPMMSTHVDVFIGLKAKEGKGEEVEKDLLAYRESLVSDSMQYPMNLAKVNASQVARHGDYVFFVMLGAFDERTDVTEEDALKFAQEQVQIGLDAIEEHFKS